MLPPADSGEPLRLVLVEDSEDDAGLILRELRRAGFRVTARRVETAQSLIDALASGDTDLIISDHNLPRFSAPEALTLVRAHAGDLPFIIVSGSMGEEVAVGAMKAGAADYLIKGQLSRLGPAVRRELSDADQRRQRRLAEASLRRTEDQLRQAQRMEAVGRLAGGVAHDFNNLLTAILGYSELVLEQMDAGAPGRDDVDEIRKAGERAAALTRQLLAFNRQQVFEPRVVDFNEVICHVERLLRRVTRPEVELATELHPTIGHVKLDVGQFEQVLMNLVINASDAMPHGGHLDIRTDMVTFSEARNFHEVTLPPGDYLVVGVHDTGTGMTSEVASQIFEPFFTTKGEGLGTGLGLSTVYGIVRQTGGHITVDTEAGRGTVFEIFLPCVDEPLDDIMLTASTPVELEGSEMVMLVDDDERIRNLLRRTLEEAGYSVMAAADGTDALALANAHDGLIDILVTDVVMPRMGGTELAAQLSAARRRIPVLYMSGHTSRRESQLPPLLSAYLQKPFTPSVLIRRVRELLDAAPKAA